MLPRDWKIWNTQSGCKPALSTPYMPTFVFYFSFSSYSINVKFKTLQKVLISISINPLFRNKKKKGRKEERKKEKRLMKKSENRPIPWVRLDGLSVSGTIFLHYWQTLSHNPPHDACLWVAKLECKLSVLIEKTTSIPAYKISNPDYFTKKRKQKTKNPKTKNKNWRVNH